MTMVEAGSGLSPQPTMTADEALVEAHRCLMCWDAPCTRACPTSIDVPGFIKRIATNDLVGSARTILESNLLGGSCARVCPTEVLCAGACVLNDLHERPIDIGRLQAYATDDVVFGDVKLFSAGAPTGFSVGVIGGGPAGLSCAGELAKLGHQAVVYEASNHAGGLNTYGVANYKMDLPTSLAEVEFIEGLGVEIRTGVAVGADVPVAEVLEAHDAVFVGVGLGSVPPIGLEGEDLDGCEDALEFIADVRRSGRDLTGRTVAVIGGGNTSIDAATQAAMSGADHVYLIYRRGRSDMRAYPHDIERALANGVEFVHWSMPVRVEGDGKVETVVCQRTRLNDDGWPENLEGTEYRLPADMLLRATGQEKRSAWLTALPGIETDGGGRVVVNDTYRTGNDRIWAGGDCVNGGKEVVNAVEHGKRAAMDIDNTLRAAAAGK